MATTTGIVGHPAADRKEEMGVYPLGCGCVLSRATKTSGWRVLSRCGSAERLWEELLKARKEVLRRGGRARGHQERVDAFHERRGAYYGHLGLVA